MKLVLLTIHIIFVENGFSNKNTYDLWSFKHFYFIKLKKEYYEASSNKCIQIFI